MAGDRRRIGRVGLQSQAIGNYGSASHHRSGESREMTPDEKAARIAQCRTNIEALLNHYEMPPVKIIAAQTDRLMAADDTNLFVRKLLTSGAFDSWDFVENHGATAFRGWREL